MLVTWTAHPQSSRLSELRCQAPRTLLTGGTGLSVVLSGTLTKCHIRGLEQQTFIVLSWRLAIRAKGWFLGPLRGVPTAVRAVSSRGCPCVSVSQSPPYRDASQTGIAPTLTASSYLSHLFKPHCKYSPVLSFWRPDLSV